MIDNKRKTHSGLEDRIIEHINENNEKLKEQGIEVDYECEKIKYTQVLNRKYTPDFTLYLKNGEEIHFETKGYWRTSDRMKHKAIKLCNKDINIVFVFQNPNNKISKKSKTTYADYCDKLGYKWVSEKDFNILDYIS